jgi:hypothetical protein
MRTTSDPPSIRRPREPWRAPWCRPAPLRLSPRRAALRVALCMALCAAPAAWGQAPVPASPPPSAPPPLLAPLSAGQALALPAVDPEIPSPAAFLGHPLGTRFTRYSDLRAYLAALAAASERVATWDYGATWLDRPLTLVAVSSEANLARLDEIRRDRGLLADPSRLAPAERQALAERLPAVVWLAYGVHGDEASSPEAAMATAYLLAAARGPLAAALERVVVLIDPVSNPDGRERYVASYEERRGAFPDAAAAAAEHHQPWPGGRGNHYLFDLNRDWSWATQPETRARLVAVQQWQPQVYVDLHEMSPSETYFFPPSAEPVNPLIDPRVVRWLATFGRGNAAAFDRLGWIYFNAESFDLFYPGYADSYLSFRGAVGMTYEMAGGGRAGLALERPDGSVLTLADRVARHLVASLATVETAAAEASRLIADFAAARTAAVERPGELYLWADGVGEAAALADALRLHGIEVRRLAGAETLPVRRIGGAGETGERAFAAGTWAVSAAQPLGGLIRALLDADSPLGEEFLAHQRRRVEQDLDAAFYDVTAWSLPLAYNVPAWRAEAAAVRAVATVGDARGAAVPGSVATAGAEAGEFETAVVENAVAETAVGWLLPPAGIATYRVAARLQREGVRFRVALDGAVFGGRSYPTGTLFVPRLGNPSAAALLAALAAAEGQPVHAAATSASSGGISLGSPRMADVGRVRAGVIGGAGVRSTSFGALWHLLDRQVEARPTRLDAANLGEVDLSDLEVLVMPDGGGWEGALDEEAAAALEAWLRGGGVLIAVGGAIDWLRARELATVVAWEPEDAATDPEAPAGGGSGPPAAAADAGDADRPALDLARRPLDVPGAVLATSLAPGHPLAAGVPAPPPVLFTGSRLLLPTGEPRVDVLTVALGEPVLAGFTWPESRSRLAGALLVASEAVGRGRVVLFSQDPAFRGFWRGTFPLLLNAAVHGPSLLAADPGP